MATLKGILSVAIIVIGTGTLADIASAGDDEAKETPRIEPYEPNAFGYTSNKIDDPFWNIRLSIKFALIPELMKKTSDHNHLYFSFTGYWGFYITSRPSGPVVGKEYNPQLFFSHDFSNYCASDGKYFVDKVYLGQSQNPTDCYFAIGYNHDSNGQVASSLEQFNLVQRDQGTRAAYDAISRGWDYIRLTAKFVPHWTGSNKLSVYPTFKFFLPDGLLQGTSEELHDWERPLDGKERKEVDGASVLAKWQSHLWSLPTKVAVNYTTGYKNPFKYNTVRLEAGVALAGLPIVAWAQNGYMSDLAQYYRRTNGYGIQVELGTF